MIKKIAKYSLIILVDFFLVVLAIDFLLNWLDPIGAIKLQHTINAMNRVSVPHEDWGYVFTPGMHDLHSYTATINPDYSRYVPATEEGRPCQIAFVGDSLTFGWGVNDDETWVNILASELPDVSAKLIAFPGWNAPNVINVLSMVEADGFIWLLFENDNGGMKTYNERMTRIDTRPAVDVYYRILYVPLGELTAPDADQQDSFLELIDTARVRDDVLTLNFEDDPLAQPWTQSVPRFTLTENRISLLDGHPNADGNIEIADAIRPYAREFIGQQCELNLDDETLRLPTK